MSSAPGFGLNRMETKNLDIYGFGPSPWSRARDPLAATHGPGVTFFLGTIRPDAGPHTAGIGASGRHTVVRYGSGDA